MLLLTSPPELWPPKVRTRTPRTFVKPGLFLPPTCLDNLMLLSRRECVFQPKDDDDDDNEDDDNDSGDNDGDDNTD